MEYLLLVLLITLFLISYCFCGRDFFAPSTVQILVFGISTLMSCFLLADFSYELHSITVWLIFSTLALGTFIGIIVHQFFRVVSIPELPRASSRVSPITNYTHLFVLVFVCWTILWQIIEIARIAGTAGTINQIMHTFHTLNAYSTDIEGRLPFVLRLSLHIVYILMIIHCFNLIRFFSVLSTQKKVLNITIVILCIVSGLLTGGRGSMMMGLFACAIIYHLVRIQRLGKYKTYSLGFILRIIVIGITAIFLFYIFSTVVGRRNSLGLFDYVKLYVGTHIINLDIYLQNPPPPSNIWGKYTFFGLITNLREFGLLNIEPYLGHLEFHYVDGVALGNVYTFIRIYHYDFGIVGIYVLHSLMMLIYSVFYEYVKRRKGNISILVFGLAYYGVILSFFSERFFSTIITLSFAEKMFFLVLFYKVFLQKAVQFRIRVKAISDVNFR